MCSAILKEPVLCSGLQQRPWDLRFAVVSEWQPLAFVKLHSRYWHSNSISKTAQIESVPSSLLAMFVQQFLGNFTKSKYYWTVGQAGWNFWHWTSRLKNPSSSVNLVKHGKSRASLGRPGQAWVSLGKTLNLYAEPVSCPKAACASYCLLVFCCQNINKFRIGMSF